MQPWKNIHPSPELGSRLDMSDALGEKGVCVQFHWAVQRSAENETPPCMYCTYSNGWMGENEKNQETREEK
jgi:hypothetical protein